MQKCISLILIFKNGVGFFFFIWKVYKGQNINTCAVLKMERQSQEDLRTDSGNPTLCLLLARN